MPYRNTSELPEEIRQVLPEHAQHIFKEAFNSAYEEYADPKSRRTDDTKDQIAFKVAWSAVKQKYEKRRDGRWHNKD